MTILESEKWVDVPGYEGVYQASSHGRVKSLTRKISGRGGHPFTFRGKILKPDIDKDGYHIYVLQFCGTKKKIKGHRIIASCFIGVEPKGMQVAHRDGDPGNNSADNLRYATAKSNTGDKRVHGTLARGISHGRSKVSDQDVLYIRESKDSLSALSRLYGISSVQVRRIKNREFWRHV